MRSLWLLLLTGCEKMEEPGALFSAVPADTPAVTSAVGAETVSDFDFPEPEVISSEELQSGGSGSADEPDTPADTEHPADHAPEEPAEDGSASEAAADAAPAVVEDAPTPAEPVAEDPAASVGSIAPMAATTLAGTGWPVRLVKTIPDTNPPRAILGLPSGEELVVSPGTMVPEHGLVVIAIGPSSAQLAQVTPQGDHAAISPLTLQTMY